MPPIPNCAAAYTGWSKGIHACVKAKDFVGLLAPVSLKLYNLPARTILRGT